VIYKNATNTYRAWHGADKVASTTVYTRDW